MPMKPIVMRLKESKKSSQSGKRSTGMMVKNGLEIKKKRSPIQQENQRRMIYMNKVLFFAHLRDTVGKESIEYEANGISVLDLKQKIAEKYDLKVDNVMVSINEEFA